MENNAPSQDDIRNFANQVIATLPDSLSARKVCLNVLRFYLPRKIKNTEGKWVVNPEREKAIEMLHHLKAEEKIQQKFFFARDGHHGRDGQ
ncbi:MAG TPA: hypothetical protein VN516_00100 [Candidatus Baltobacteraceae bacterium]|nr:hypothetical protein [Candidatus Baltobacteraceae bacterium]